MMSDRRNAIFARRVVPGDDRLSGERSFGAPEPALSRRRSSRATSRGKDRIAPVDIIIQNRTPSSRSSIEFSAGFLWEMLTNDPHTFSRAVTALAISPVALAITPTTKEFLNGNKTKVFYGRSPEGQGCKPEPVLPRSWWLRRASDPISFKSL